MITSTAVIFSTLLGGFLGRRLNVFVLFPAMLVGVALGAGVTAVGSLSLLETLPVLGSSFAGRPNRSAASPRRSNARCDAAPPSNR
jgi:hypothetical protein